MKALTIIGTIAVLIGFSLGLTWLAWKGWEFVAPSIHAPSLGFWQFYVALCLLGLVARLFKGDKEDTND